MFLVFEGTNACGKTTIMRETCAELEKLGHKVFQTKMPTRGEIGLMLRKYQHSQDYAGMSGVTIALLGAADKFENVHSVVSPKLDEGYIVACDRLLLSAYIYNKMDGVPFEYTDAVFSLIKQPDLTIVLNLPENMIKENLKCRSKGELDRYEKNFDEEFNTFQEAIAYCKNKGQAIEVVNITRDVSANVKKILKVLKPYLKNR